MILVHEPLGRLCGFSTQTLLECEVAGEPLRALFSGDTIIDRQHWGDPALSHAWGQFAPHVHRSSAGCAFYWLLLSQGFRTYRFLPLFFHEFYPRHDVPSPDGVRSIVASLAEPRYGAAFDSTAGVVRSHDQQYRLREGVGDTTADRLRDPHVRFFTERNPGHHRGDDLCCLAPLTRENFTRAAYRVIGAAEPVLEAT